MKNKYNPINYWNKVANKKTFTHPLNSPLLEKLVNKNACIVDYGCGYGRLVETLKDIGFTNVQGFDFSIELIKRGHKNGVDTIFPIKSASDLPFENNSVDCILLFAVLTCIPDNKSQTELLANLFSKLKIGGFIYISDYYLQTESIEMERYDYLNDDEQNFGVFALPERVIFRHHTNEWIMHLLRDFKIIQENRIEVKTMNGNMAEAFQLIAQKQTK